MSEPTHSVKYSVGVENCFKEKNIAMYIGQLGRMSYVDTYDDYQTSSRQMNQLKKMSSAVLLLAKHMKAIQITTKL